MKIKMLQSAAGPGFAYRPGDKVDHKPNNEAHAWIACGAAEPDLDLELVVGETATAPAPQGLAVLRRRRARATPPGTVPTPAAA